MPPARPLRDVFTELTGTAARSASGADAESLLAAAGHPDLPAGLVAEAVVSYADTAPPEVAEHLAPFVVAHGPVPVDPDDSLAVEPENWLDVLASAPDGLDSDPAGAGDLAEADGFPMPHEDAAGLGDDPFALDFGSGASDLDHDGTDLDYDGTDLDQVATGFGGGASGADLVPVPDDAAGHHTVDHGYVDDLVAFDDLDGDDGLDRSDPGAGHRDHDGAGPATVDGDPADGQ